MVTKAGQRKGGGGGGGGFGPVLIVIIVVIAALIIHFRARVASFVVPKMFGRTTNSNKPGQDFDALGWANWIEKKGTNDEMARCCYRPDFQDMYDCWCGPESDIDPLRDFGLLSECSEALKGRTEASITEFSSAHYTGKVSQASQYPHNVFYVTKFGRKNKGANATQYEERSSFCKVLKKCANVKKGEATPAMCRGIRKVMGDCFN